MDLLITSRPQDQYTGILPLAKSSFEVSPEFSFDGWQLPGHGASYLDCGHKLVFGCVDVEAHKQAKIDGLDVVGKVFVKLKKRTCLRAVCPICYEKWAGKEAHKLAYRISQWRTGKPVHVALSVPESLWGVPLEDLRSKVYKLASKVGIYGGSCIVHPFRQKCKACGSAKETYSDQCLNCGCSEFLWVFSPHFHLIGFGWIDGHKVSELYRKEGWITKNLGIRESVGGTALYQLSHCGIKGGKQAVTWFGRLSYNSDFKVVPEVVEKDVCPICQAELVRLVWVGIGEMPYEDEGDYFDVSENWVEGSAFCRRGG